jgi:hypothetical protein
VLLSAGSNPAHCVVVYHVRRPEIRIVGAGVQLGPLCTSATDLLIVPVPGDYDDGEFGGMKIGR